MLEAPVPNEEAERLLENGLNVLPLMEGAGGRDLHPNSTHGVLIRVYPVNSFQGTMDETDQSVGISGIGRAVIAVENLDQAVGVYGEGLGLEVDASTVDAERGVETVIVHPPTGGTIELAAVRDESRAYAGKVVEHLADREGLFELVLQAEDLDRVRAALTDRGLNVIAEDRELVVDKADTFGAQIRIASA